MKPYFLFAYLFTSLCSTAQRTTGANSAMLKSEVLVVANNLSDVANAGTARTNLGLGTAATQSSSTFLQSANNLSDVANAGTARTNLGATTIGGNIFTLTNPSAVRYFKINADNTVSARTAAEMLGDIGAQASGSYAITTNNLSDVANAGTARTNLGATTIGGNIFTLTNPSADGFIRANSDNTVTHRTYANVKIDLSLNNVENTALSTWGGSSNITTLGNITAGAWTGTTIARANGGTGLTSAGSNNNVLTSNGTDWVSSANTGGWTVHRVSGSNFTTTSTSLVDITGLVTATLSTATLYEFEAVLYVNSSSTAGMAVGVQQSGTGSGQIGVWTGTATNAAATGLAIGSNSLNTAGAACVLINGDGSISIRGYVRTGSSGSPTISLKALKTTSGTATVYIGSVFRYRLAS